MRVFDIAVVGCGGVSHMHFEGYRAHPERVRVAAACDLDPERGQEAQSRHGVPAVFASLEEMLEGASFNVAVVCTPTPVREEVVTRLARAGKHILVEKPMASGLDEARRMVSACEEAGVRLAVDQNFRYHYGFHIARRLFERDWLGAVRGVTHHDLTLHQDSGWRLEGKRHALSVMGVHWLDGLRWMLRSEATEILCRTSSSPLVEGAGETDAFAQIHFASGVTASYVQSFDSLVPRTETILLLEKGTLVLGYGGAFLYDKERGDRPRQEWTNPYAGPRKPESAFRALNQLLWGLEHDEESTNSGQDNLKTISLLEGAYRSAEQGSVVSFEEGLLS